MGSKYIRICIRQNMSTRIFSYSYLPIFLTQIHFYLFSDLKIVFVTQWSGRYRLYHTLFVYNSLCRTISHCTACSAVQCTALRYTALHCAALRYTALHCITRTRKFFSSPRPHRMLSGQTIVRMRRRSHPILNTTFSLHPFVCMSVTLRLFLLPGSRQI